MEEEDSLSGQESPVRLNPPPQQIKMNFYRRPHSNLAETPIKQELPFSIFSEHVDERFIVRELRPFQPSISIPIPKSMSPSPQYFDTTSFGGKEETPFDDGGSPASFLPDKQRRHFHSIN